MLLKAGLVMIGLAAALAGVLAAMAWTDDPARSAAVASAQQAPTEPLKRSDPGVEPWKEATISQPSENSEPKEPEPETVPEPDSRSRPDPKPEPESEPEPVSEPDFGGEPPRPTEDQISAASEPRHYSLPDGAIMGLTVNAIDIHNVPVFDSVGDWALGNGVGHHPETSMPWSKADQGNVYLAGHKLGFPGTASHLVFYRLGELGRGDEILLKDRDGDRYLYRVTETFKITPRDSWATGEVPGRDMVTLQTCTGPNWKHRLIVRAERV